MPARSTSLSRSFFTSQFEPWREEARCSWAEIGKVMGVTRQAAWQRFSHGPVGQAGSNSRPGSLPTRVGTVQQRVGA